MLCHLWYFLETQSLIYSQLLLCPLITKLCNRLLNKLRNLSLIYIHYIDPIGHIILCNLNPINKSHLFLLIFLIKHNFIKQKCVNKLDIFNFPIYLLFLNLINKLTHLINRHVNLGSNSYVLLRE